MNVYVVTVWREHEGAELVGVKADLTKAMLLAGGHLDASDRKPDVPLSWGSAEDGDEDIPDCKRWWISWVKDANPFHAARAYNIYEIWVK